MRKVWLAAFAALISALAAGCSSTPSAPSPSASAGPFDASIAEAHAADPGGPQETTLREAKAAGEMSYEQLDQLKELMFDCFTEAGLMYEDRSPVVSSSGILELQFFMTAKKGPDADAKFALGDACQEQYILAAQSAYLAQPASLEAAEAAWLAMRPEVVACLEKHGMDVPAEATRDDLIRLSIEENRERVKSDPEAMPCDVEALP